MKKEKKESKKSILNSLYHTLLRRCPQLVLESEIILADSSLLVAHAVTLATFKRACHLATQTVSFHKRCIHKSHRQTMSAIHHRRHLITGLIQAECACRQLWRFRFCQTLFAWLQDHWLVMFDRIRTKVPLVTNLLNLFLLLSKK